MTGKLVLCRHGQSTWNLENLFTGWHDVDLTEQGPSRGWPKPNRPDGCSDSSILHSTLPTPPF